MWALLPVLLQLGTQIFSIFESKSAATPIVAAIQPLALKAMSAAETVFGPGNGAAKQSSVLAMLQAATSAGLVVAKGGTAHTLEEFQANLPAITDTINATVVAVNSMKTPTVQDIVNSYLNPAPVAATT